ncbi:siderophore-interacting protein [Rhizobium gallicum bv. gallicum R602sp]|uniref:Siderophore-interacting protein n=2 Tax=Rhizobium/Agrobacterium group TaxID=227290 RepID=A0A0B4X1H2_9HYPH|nr:siderophore-interacting protein [Rhizobium gallicum bv. gallicum R602sp]
MASNPLAVRAYRQGLQNLTTDFDWYLLVGDETALPAIGRRLEELTTGFRPCARGRRGCRPRRGAGAGKQGQADDTLASSRRGTGRYHGSARPGFAWPHAPAGDGYVWIACETLAAKRPGAIMVDERQHPKAWIKAAGYRQRGQADFHETHGHCIAARAAGIGLGPALPDEAARGRPRRAISLAADPRFLQKKLALDHLQIH